jgi:hypothetical protein
MRSLRQSTAYNLAVFMTDASDHIAGKTGLTLTITASKDGAAFASITPTVTERGTGWYNLSLTTSHTDTLGDLALHVTSAGADPTDLACQVQPFLATVATNLDATVSSRLADADYTAPPSAASIKTEIEQDGSKLDEVHRIHGLKSGQTMTVTPTSRVAGAITQTIGGDGTTTTTVTRA